MFKQPVAMTENESKELALDSYVTHIHKHYCTTCGGMESFSRCYEVWLHPTKTRTTNLRDLRSVPGPTKNLPMAIISLKPQAVSVCIICARTYRPSGQPETIEQSLEAWQETLRRKYAAPAPTVKVATSTAAAPKKQRTIPTLDMI